MSQPDIEAVRRKHEATLMSLPNVVGVGIGERDGKPVLKVFVSRKLPLTVLSADAVVPSELDGWETDVEEIGEVFAGN
jgi:hypothetical protein